MSVTCNRKRKLQDLQEDESDDDDEVLLNPCDYYETHYVQVKPGALKCRIGGGSVVAVTVLPEVAAFLTPKKVDVLMCSKQIVALDNGNMKEKFTWQPAVAKSLIQRNKWLSILLGKLLSVCDLHYLRNNDGTINPSAVQTSMVMEWLGRIRLNLHRFRSGQLQNQNLTLHEITTSNTRLSRPPRNTTRMHGCKVQMHTFMKHRRGMQLFMNYFHSCGGTFPMQNTKEVEDTINDAYLATRYTHSSGNDESERELRFACLVQSLCPHVFPQCQEQQTIQLDKIADACHREYEAYQNGYLLELGCKFAGLSRESNTLTTGLKIARS